MAAIISAQMFEPGHEVLGIVLDNLAMRQNRQEKEAFYDAIGEAFFPGFSYRYKWPVINRSSATVNRVDFYQLFISIKDDPINWFKNLRLLQIRARLRLKDVYYLHSGIGICGMSEAIAKINVIGEIVGRENLEDHRRPDMHPIRTVRHCPYINPIRGLLRRRNGFV